MLKCAFIDATKFNFSFFRVNQRTSLVFMQTHKRKPEENSKALRAVNAHQAKPEIK